MANRADILAGAAFVRLYRQRADFAAGLAEAALKLRSFGTSLTLVSAIARQAALQLHKVTESFVTLGKRTAIAGAAMTTAILGTAKHFAHFGSTLNDMSERTGISVEALSQLGYAARQSGSDIEELELAIKHMQNRVAEKGIVGTAGLPADQQLEVVADQIAAIEDSAERTALAIDIFGRAGTRMLPMLIGGAAGLRAMRMEADALGLTILERDAKAADALGDAWDRLKDTTMGLVFATGAALADSLTKIFNQISQVIGSVSRWVKEHQQLVRVVVFSTVAMTAMGVGLAVFAKTLGIVTKTIAVFLTLAGVLKLVLKLLAFLGVSVGAYLTPVLTVIAAVVGGIALLAGGVLLSRLRGAILRGALFIFETLKSMLENLPRIIAKAIASIGQSIDATLRGLREVFPVLMKAANLFFELAKDVMMQLPAIAAHSAGLIVREYVMAIHKVITFAVQSVGDMLKSMATLPSIIDVLTLNPFGIRRKIAEALGAALTGQAAATGGMLGGLFGGPMPEFKISEGTRKAYEDLLSQLGAGRGTGDKSPGSRGMQAGSAFVTYSATALAASGRGAALDRLVRIAELHKELTKEGAGHAKDLVKEWRRIADGLRH